MRRQYLIVLAILFWAFGPSAMLAQTTIGFGGVPHDPDQPVDVTAESLTLDQSSGEVTFTGDVVVVQGDLRLAADEVRVRYSDDSGTTQVTEVRATGNVLVTRGTDAAEGEEAFYDVPAGIFRVTGNVVIVQGPTTIAGDRLVLDMNTGNGRVEGRVRTTLTPSENQ